MGLGYWLLSGKGGDCTEKRIDLNDVNKKNKRKKNTIRAVVVGVIIVAVVLVAVNWETIIAPFRDIAIKTGEGGFPVSLPGSASYVMNSLGSNFYLLTDTYIYTYNSDGAQLAGIQHGFQNPSVSSGEKRALVFDKNGKGFKVYSRNAEVYSKTLEDTIVFAKMGKNDHAAVVTTSSRYSNYLCVFNDDGKQVFRYASPTEKIMQVCFSDNESFVYLSVVGEKDGELESAVLCFDITKEQGAIWREQIGNALTYSLECCADGIYGVTEQGMFLLNASSGQLLSKNTFSQTVTGICETDGGRVVFFHDTAFNGNTAIMYDGTLTAVASRAFENMSAFDISRGTLYVLSKNKLYAYSDSLKKERVYELDDSYSGVKVIGSYAYFLGYNSVQRIAL